MALCDSVGLRTGTDTATAHMGVPALGARTALSSHSSGQSVSLGSAPREQLAFRKKRPGPAGHGPRCSSACEHTGVPVLSGRFSPPALGSCRKAGLEIARGVLPFPHLQVTLEFLWICRNPNPSFS